LHKRIRERIQGSFTATLGYFLSPLSWWNDLYVNIPIAYVLAWPFGLIDSRLFGLFFIVFYWATNLLGFLLLHHGLRSVVTEDLGALSSRNRFLRDLVISLAYSGILLLLVYLGVIRYPQGYFKP